MSSLSIVATVYNDAGIVPVLVEELIKNIPREVDKYEIILVNDCSRDNSEQAIRDECRKNPNVKGILLSRNFGQQIALSAGIENASNEYVIIMDGDLQNPPAAIPLIFNKIKEGYDIVYSVSKKRNGIGDGISSFIFWGILTKIFRMNVIKHQITLKIMTKQFAERYSRYGEITRTVDAIAIDISSNYAIMEIPNEKRLLGKSNYNFSKRVNLALDMIISLSSAPLNFMIYLGFFTFLLSIVGLVYYLYCYLSQVVPPGYTSLQLSIFFFGGLIVLILGIIGRYLANIYSEVRQRPLYHIKNTINL